MCLNCPQFLVFLLCVYVFCGAVQISLFLSQYPVCSRDALVGEETSRLATLWVKFIGTTYSWVEEIPP